MNTSSNTIDNYINGAFVAPAIPSYIQVINPSDGSVLGDVAVSDFDDVQKAVDSATMAFYNWSSWTMKARAAIILKFHALVQKHATDLAETIVLENGKNFVEALADVAKGNETVEYACSIPNTQGAGRILPVSSGNIVCQDRRQPIGIVVSIVPFNFPFMVPMWTIPIALVLGNVVIVKPSEKVPLTLHKTMALWEQAGLPKGCLNLIHGTRKAVETLISHPAVRAVTFVGSSPVAKAVSEQCAKHLNKRCLALGGAKNHLVALSDCHVQSAAQDIVTSFCGCAGQRCMAASVLLLADVHSSGDLQQAQQSKLINEIVRVASEIQLGTGSGQMGPVIDDASYDKIISYINLALQDNAQILLDGRSLPRRRSTSSESIPNRNIGGNWIGPTILLHHQRTDRTMCEEVFGPVLSIYRCSSWDEAISIENDSPFGNAAAIYTTNGGHAQWFLSKFKAAMLGCNIGIPVPREPFSFGGLYGTVSKYGSYCGDITGDAAVEFFSNRIKVTTKWPEIDQLCDTNQKGTDDKNSEVVNPSNTNAATGSHIDRETTSENESLTTVDHAHFAGQM